MPNLRVVVLVLTLAAVGAAPSGASDDGDAVLGDWTFITALGGRDVESKLTVERHESGALLARYTDSGGATRALEGFTYEDGVMRFTRTMGPRTIVFSGQVEGDRVTGRHTFGTRRVPAWGARGAKAVAALRAERRKANERGADLEEDYERHSRRAAPRDAFPVLFDPFLAPADKAPGIREDEPVLGVALGGEAKAYPIAIMGRHELANDTCGGQPIAASW